MQPIKKLKYVANEMFSLSNSKPLFKKRVFLKPVLQQDHQLIGL